MISPYTTFDNSSPRTGLERFNMSFRIAPDKVAP